MRGDGDEELVSCRDCIRSSHRIERFGLAKAHREDSLILEGVGNIRDAVKDVSKTGVDRYNKIYLRSRRHGMSPLHIQCSLDGPTGTEFPRNPVRILCVERWRGQTRERIEARQVRRERRVSKSVNYRYPCPVAFYSGCVDWQEIVGFLNIAGDVRRGPGNCETGRSINQRMIHIG